MDSSVISFARYGQVRSVDEELIRQYGQLLDRNGYVRATAVPEGFAHAEFLARFGEFYPSPSGELIDDIVAEPGMDGYYYGGNRRSLLPHTEGYEYEGAPPRYLALWCVVPAEGNGGETTLLDAQPLLAQLTEEERAYLASTPFDWRASEGLRHLGLDRCSRHTILQTVAGTRLLRFSYNNIRAPGTDDRPDPDARVSGFLDRIRAAFEAEHVKIRYDRNDLLQWDNWRVLHARDAFSDHRRHLRRVQIVHGE